MNYTNRKFLHKEILEELKSQVDMYMVLPEREKILIVGDILITYSMEWNSTLHFPFFVEDDEFRK